MVCSVKPKSGQVTRARCREEQIVIAPKHLLLEKRHHSATIWRISSPTGTNHSRAMIKFAHFALTTVLLTVSEARR
jgi:hypothetical protein